MGLLPVAALLLVAGQLDVDAMVVVETRAGEAPLRAGDPPRAGVAGAVTPGAALELLGRDLTLTLEYGPRIYQRLPNETGGCPGGAVMCLSKDRSSRLTPLILHVATLSAAARASDTLTFTGGASMSVGEADYSTLPQIFAAGAATSGGMMTGGTMTGGTTTGGTTTGGTTTGTTTGGSSPAALPTIIDVLAVTGRAGALDAVSRIWTLGLAGEVTYRAPLNSQTQQTATGAAQPLLLPRQTALRAEPTATARLSRQDDLLLLSPVSYQTYSSTVTSGTVAVVPKYLMIAPQVGWRTHPSRTSELHLVAGLAYVRNLGVLPPGKTLTPFSPVGNVELQTHPYRSDGIASQLVVALTVDYSVDPVLAVAAPHGTATVHGNVLFSRTWMAGVEGMFATNLTAHRVTLYDETLASVVVPIRHRLSDNMVLEFGGRWADRAPHLNAPNFSFHQRELWAYGMLTVTTRRLPLWMPP